jgi:hypothetical protein
MSNISELPETKHHIFIQHVAGMDEHGIVHRLNFDAEKELLKHTADLWNKFLPYDFPEHDMKDIQHHINAIQNIISSRIARRIVTDTLI